MMKKITKFVTLLLALAMVFSLAACSSGKDKDKADGSADIATLIATEPNSADEAAKLYQQLMQKENDILAANSELWNKVFLSANKNSTMIEDGTNYGDFLLATIESAKDGFSADELKTLKAGAEQIKEIEGKLTILEQKYPGCGTAPGAGDSVSAEEAGMTASGSDLMKFPSFQGKDLDGNDVDSSKLFAGNSVTVVNFWFTTCNPCVGELADLEALNKDLAAKGGAVVGINSFTLDGDKTAIAEAKDILAKKGVTYSNLWFASDSEAGKFTAGLYSFPTTYVVDKNGNIVGQPIVGGITAPIRQRSSTSSSIRRSQAANNDPRQHPPRRALLTEGAPGRIFAVCQSLTSSSWCSCSSATLPPLTTKQTLSPSRTGSRPHSAAPMPMADDGSHSSLPSRSSSFMPRRIASSATAAKPSVFAATYGKHTSPGICATSASATERFCSTRTGWPARRLSR